MSLNKRSLRSTHPTSSSTTLANSIPSPVTFNPSLSSTSKATIQILPPGTKLSGLTNADSTLLYKKQRQLELKAASLLATLQPGLHFLTALSATLIFAQHEAGTAVCIDPSGWLLTCSHCIADNLAEWAVMANRRKWLLYFTGQAVQVECRAWDPKRDLALLKIIAIKVPAAEAREVGAPSFAFVSLSTGPPAPRERIICIGQPGRDDLESEGNKSTNYNLVEISEGMFRGMVAGADPHDNSRIGTLKHDAWTYWGHSGAPLLKEADGRLVGLHSSWDDKTAMRHGIPWVAIEEFLKEHLPSGANAAVAESRGAGRADFSKKRKLIDKDEEGGGRGNGFARR